MMGIAEILQQFAIVVCASLVGSLIFTFIFVNVLRYSISRSASKVIDEEGKVKIAEWLQSIVKNGITDALKDEKIRNLIIEILELVKERLIKEDKEK